MRKPNLAFRLKLIPPYLFKRLRELEKEVKGAIIDLGEGNPDLPPPKMVIKTLAKALQKPEIHRYPKYAGNLKTKIAVARWYKKRFNVDLDPETEVAVSIGSKEGVAHFIWGVCDKGDVFVTTDPSYPIYHNQPLLAGARLITLPLKEDNDFLPDLKDLKKIRKIKLLCLNFPHNPTTTQASLSFFKDVIELAQQKGFYVMNDNVYSEIYFSLPPPSILQVEGAKDIACEFHSFSKSFNMAGWRLGFVVGNRELIKAMLKIKENVDSGPFDAIQEAGIYALTRANSYTQKLREIYKKRQEILLPVLNDLGFRVKVPQATFYIWAKIPQAVSSMEFTEELLKKKKILVAPGVGFGKEGEGYVRLSLTVNTDKIRLAAKRLSY